MIEKVAETINFPEEEEKVLELWKKLDVFHNCLKQSKNKPRYSFYDGPPFATGLPHYGHILAGTIKDIVTRYAHQTGFHVERRFGWDTHGLPVEFEIDNALGIKGPDDVAKMGIANYNAECRKIVMRYAEEWERIIARIGRWIDFKNDYKTLYPWYMESIWWVFKELYSKGLVYQGVKVMPFSTGCNTPLSNFEAGQNYKDVVDPSVVVAFPLLDEKNVFLLAWTTTPWTLPSNLALCCNPELEYVEVVDSVTGRVYIILESSLELIYKSKDLYTLQGKRKGVDLLGKQYEPLFPYFAGARTKGAFRVLNDSYVTSETGTGIVHQAPYFGEDDYRCCLKAGIISKDQDIVCPVDSQGRFTEPIKEFLGKYVKDADKEIIKHLQSKQKLIFSGSSKHSYPFCWRSDTPLIYKAVPSWFVSVETIKDKLVESNTETYWVPNYVKDKRFGNWLKDARDWNISRNRYWGNPIPLWISEDGKEVVCIGSIAELEALTGSKITDIHRESIDHLTIPSKRPGQPPLRRVSEVFDCWFESGSMPYAQVHYPFENRKEFESSFPADFIAEGIDQTRGWFYTLLVLSTALFSKPPFKNLIANGLVLASDGQKMSKRKKNYPDPLIVVGKHSADALRLYLINSPVVRGENLRFKEEGVKDIVKDVFLPWYNAFRFLLQNVERFEREEKLPFVYKDTKDPEHLSDNITDKWILSFTQSLLQFLKKEMQSYRLYTVVPRLIKYIDNLTNWYVRMNRKRIKGDTGAADCQHALNTLFCIVYAMIRINAPFTPFFTEFMFQRLRKLLPPSKENMDSVHYQMIPEPNPSLIDENIERAISCMQTIIELGRVVRDRKTLPLKYPLPEVVVIHQDPKILEEVVSLEPYILNELNVKKLTVTTDKEKYQVKLRAEPDHKTLGSRLKNEFKTVASAIKELTDEQLQDFIRSKEIEVLGHKLGEEDLRLMFSFTAEQLAERYEAHSEGNVLILLDITPDETMMNEGLAREIINRVQKLRKKAKLVPSDDVVAYYEVKDSSNVLAKIIVSHQEFIEATTKTLQKPMSELPKDAEIIIQEMQSVKGVEMNLTLVGTRSNVATQSDSSRPFAKYLNLKLQGYEPRQGATGNEATVLLETFQDGTLTYEGLREETERVFGLHACPYDLQLGNETKIDESTQLTSLNEKTVYVIKPGTKIVGSEERKGPACRFVNTKRQDRKGTFLLENPRGDYILTRDALRNVLSTVLDTNNFNIEGDDSVLALHGKTFGV